MKKTLVFILAAAMMLTLLPATAFATNYTQTEFKDMAFNAGDMVVPPSTGSIVFDNCIFPAGARIYLENYGTPVDITIQNCTFDGNLPGKYPIGIMGANNLTIKDNTINNSTRSLLLYPVSGTLTVTGNEINLVPDANEPYKVSAIQLAEPGWIGTSINIYENTVTGATNFIRLHRGFAFAANDPGVITLGVNTFNAGANEVGIDTTVDSTPENQARLTSIVTQIVYSSGTEVTANVNPTYTIVIDSSVNFGTLMRSATEKWVLKDFKVEAQNVLIEPGARINVSVKGSTGSFEMKDMSGTVPLAYKLSNATAELPDTGGSYTDFSTSRTEEGKLAVNTANITAAGSYQGTMVFTISYVPAP